MAPDRVVIVGGGVIGTMHALEACRRGFDVVHLEADQGPRRASVRNFGLVWVSGRAPGAELRLALRARIRWEEIARDVPAVGFRPDGSLTIATDLTEMALMAELVEQPDASERGLELLDAGDVRSVNPVIKGDLIGGLRCRQDAVVEPGAVLAAVRSGLEATGRYRWMPGRQAIDVQADTAAGAGDRATVIDSLGGRHSASVAVLCIGDRLSGIGGRVGAVLAGAPLRRCRLQMMQTAPTPEQLTTAIADGDSMRYYPAFDLPGRSRLPPPLPETAQWGMQLLMVQRTSGGLTIGDTHVYDEPFDFAVEEGLYERLRHRAEDILGWELPTVVRRWAGVYTVATDDRIYFGERVDAGVWVVTGPAGRGMTLAPAIAERTFDQVAG